MARSPSLQESAPPSGRRWRRHGLGLALGALLAPWPGAAGAAALEVGGRVVDPEGAPIAGARVELQPIVSRYEAGGRILAGVLEPEPAAAVVSADDGSWAIAAPEAGMWQVAISAPGRIPVRHRLVPLVVERELPPAVLERDGGAWIAVADAEGEPIAGALVWMRASAEADPRVRRRSLAWQPRGRFARTDEHGNVRLSRLRGQPIEVFAFAVGFLPSPGVEIGGDRGRVVLERGRRLAMRFLTSSGEPAAQALVGVGRLQWVAAKTDHRGRASLFVAPDEPLPFSLRLPSGQRESGTLEVGAEALGRAPEEAMEVTLETPVVLTGRVVDAASREPAAGAWVWLGGDPGRIERADRTGGYRLVAGSDRYWQVGAAAPGYQPALERGRRAAGEGGERDGPTLVLRRLAAIAGRVVDEAGEPVAGAEIEAAEPIDEHGRLGEPVRAVSRADGGFRIAGLAAGAGYEVRTRAAGFAPALVSARAQPGVDLEIVLTAGRSVVGRLVTEDGAPVAGASLVVTPGGAAWMSMRGALPAEPPFAESGSDGGFRFDGLAPDAAVMVVDKAGFAPKRVPLFDASASPGGSPPPLLDLGEVVMDRGGTVTGFVRDDRERPLAGVEVAVVGSATAGWRYGRQDPESGGHRTGEEGRFEIGGLLPGERVALMFDQRDYLRRIVDGVRVGEEQPLEVVLERAARVSGRVEDEARRPVAGLSVEARPVGRGRDRLTRAFSDPTRRDLALTDGDGEFRLERVAPGTVEIGASGAGYVAAEPLELTLAPGESRTGVVLRVGRGLAIAGTVRNGERRPVVGAIVQVYDVAGGVMGTRGPSVASGRSDAEGRYRIEGLDPRAGRLELGVHHPDYLSFRQRLDLAAGADSRLDVVLERGFSASGVVLSPLGDPVPGAAVGLDGGSGVYFGSRETAISDSGGRFEVSGLGPGSYRLFAMKEGFARTASPEPLEIVDRSLSGLILRLRRGATIRGRVLGLEPEELPTVTVVATDREGQSAEGLVGDDGVYGILNVGFGEGDVTGFTRPGGRHATASFSVDPEGGETWVDLEFDREGGSTLTGTVRLDGEPWRGVQVAAQGELGGGGSGYTDGAGRFEITGLGDGPHQVTLFGGTAIAHTETVDVRGDTEVSIDVETVRVRGRVVAAGGGEPVPRAEVSAAEVGQQPWLQRMASRIETTAGGEFELLLPANRRMTIRARAAGHSRAELELDTGPGAPIDGLELVLDRGEAIELDLRLPSGRPPSWVFAVVVDAAGRVLASETQMGPASMPLRISSVPLGDWLLRVSAEGGALATVPVSVPGPPVTLALAPEARIEVDLAALQGAVGLPGTATLRILDPSGEPLALLSWGEALESWPVHPPAAEIPSLPAGDWVLELSDDRGGVWRRPVTTTAGETVRVTFE